MNRYVDPGQQATPKVKARWRRVVALREQKKLVWREIAERLGVTIGMAQKLYKKGKSLEKTEEV